MFDFNPMEWLFGRNTIGSSNQAVKDYGTNVLKTRAQGGDVDWVPGVSVIGGDRDPVSGIVGPTAYPGSSSPSSPNDGSLPPSNTDDGVVGGGAAPKVLDEAQLSSLDSFLESLNTIYDNSKTRALVKRNTDRAKKDRERETEEGEYKGKKLSTLQDFGSAKTDTDINTRDTLENLVSSLSTLGLGGSRALTRKILAAANMSNQKANETQAKNNQSLDTAWNRYDTGYQDDIEKIEDQYGYDMGEAERQYLQEKQNTLHKKANVYNAADRTDDRTRLMNEANALNSRIAGAAFTNPSYNAERREMATPDLADYTQDIAQYRTDAIGTAPVDGLTPVGADGTTAPGNLAVRAIAVNDRDLGVKKKTEGEIAYGV